jgi:hypothetical protein
VKLHDYFAGLLTDTVNLDQARLDQLDLRVGNIVAALQADKVIKPLYEDHIPQGSWPHRTIITPLPRREFDADFLLKLTPVDAWNDDPREYLKQTRAAFKRSFAYRDMVRKKNRCVRIVYANDCHVDVVPHLVLADGRQVIVNYADNEFEDTNPVGFTDWMKQQDGLANGHLRRTIRLLKYLRDYKTTFSVPSVILTTLLGDRVQPWDSAGAYPDLPSAFVRLLGDLDDWLGWHPDMPVLADPSCPNTTFNHRWDQDKYANFAKWIKHYRAKADAAFAETDKDESLALWREIFGDAFAKSTAPAAAAEGARVRGDAPVAKSAVATVVARKVRAPGEQFIDELHPVRLAYEARIDATVRKRDGWRDGTPLRRLGRTSKRMTLDFQFVTSAPEPFTLMWKVRNNGPEAAARGSLRGTIFPDDGSRVRTESTLYRGEHYVEAYAIRNGVVVAVAHEGVRID